MNLELESQTAVVIGAAKGIGRAIAERFAAERADVVLLDIDDSVMQTASSIADEHGVRSVGVVVDATDRAELQRQADSIGRDFDSDHHVVYAAGAGSGKFGFPFWNLEPADWTRVLEINLIGAVTAAHAFAPQLVERQRGTLLFLASVAGQIGSQTDPPYSAAKAGVINFAQCAAKDLAPYNVRVNTICPGMVKTELNRSVWRAWADCQPKSKRLSYDQWAAEKIANVTPLGRWQECGDIADMAVFLASRRAANITGQTINVDGGQVMHW